MLSLLPGIALGLVVSTAAAVDLIAPASQDRSITVFAFAVDNTVPVSDQDADSLAAPDMGPLDVTTSANATVGSAEATSSASQTSAILGSSIQASGSVSASADAYDYDTHGQGTASSWCEVTFDVTNPSSFTWNGSLTASGTGAVSVSLVGPGGTIVSVSAAPNQTTPVLESGELAPETYTMTVDATGSAFADFFVYFAASASFDLLLELDPVTGGPIGEPVESHAVVSASPNPFRDACTIRHGAAPGVVSVFDLQGRLIRQLRGADGRGVHVWDGRNASGEPASPGVYFVRPMGARTTLKVVRVR